LSAGLSGPATKCILRGDFFNGAAGDECGNLVAFLYVYGTDKPIDAYAEYARANTKGEGGDLGELVLGLRKSIYNKSHLRACLET
jgi:hypothetical protein